MSTKNSIEQAAEEYVRSDECELMDLYSAHEATFKAGVAWRDEQVKELVEALNNWVEWEHEQIKKDGPYIGEAINKLIKDAEKALSPFKESKEK